MKKLLNNDFILSIICKGANILFGFVTLILLNRYLGATLKGEYTYIINYTTIISAIFQLGISSVYSKFKRKKIDNCFEIFISLSLIQFIIYVVITIILLYIVRFNNTIMWISIISVIAILTTQFRYINLIENYKYNTFVIIVIALLNSIIMLIMYCLFEKNLTYAFLVYICKDIFIILMFFKKIKLKNLFKLEYFKVYLLIIKEGFLPMLSSLLVILNYNL